MMQFSHHHACHSPLQLITPLIFTSSKEHKLQCFHRALLSVLLIVRPIIARNAAFCNSFSPRSDLTQIVQFSVILQSGKCGTWVLDPLRLVMGCCLGSSRFSHLKQREGRLESHWIFWNSTIISYKSPFSPALPDVCKSWLCLKLPKLRPLDLLITFPLILRCEWSIGIKLLERKTQNTQT